jgi:hypothetical protein
VKTRLALGAVGVVIGLVGLRDLLEQGLHNARATAVWLVGGVVLHDGVVALAAIVVVGLGTRLPGRLRPYAAAAFVVLGSVTLAAVPVLGRFGARADNPTLLDRNYVAGWLLLAGLVCVGSAAAALIRGGHPARRRREE